MTDSNSGNSKRGGGAASRAKLRTMAAGLLAGASTMALAGHAHAQTKPEDAQTREPVDVVVISGSRIQSPGVEAPTPVTSLTADDLAERAPSSLADSLNRLPQFQNSFSNLQSRTFSATSTMTVQGNYLNLRGLGVNRSLILLDGVRLPPTDASGGVDVNTLPQIIVDRVDVVTGGASAAYGSDAVVGAVNFILDKKFTGLKAVVQGGTSSRGDSNSYKLGAAYGGDFGDGAGRYIISGEHYQLDGLRMWDRSRGDQQYVVSGSGTAASPITTIANARFSAQAFGGLITTGPLAGRYFLPNGSLATFNHGSPTITTTLESGGDGAYYTNNTLNSPLRTDQVFSRVSYDFGDQLSVYAQASWAESRNSFDAANISITPAQATIFSGNAYLTPTVQTALGSTASFSLGTIRRDLPSNFNSVLNDALNTIVGAEGKFGQTWGWDVNYVHGYSRVGQRSLELKFQNFYAGLDAVKDGAGNIVCRVAITNPGRYPGCVPINIMGEGNVSSAALNWLRQASVNDTVNQLDSFAANVHGNFFATWAGPISLALGAESRKQTLDITSNADPAIPEDFTGIRGVPANTLRFIRLNAGVASGEVKVNEAYAETIVPLARDVFLAKSLDLNAAVRETDYSTSGAVTTWKVGLSYEPFNDLRLRGTVSKDIAAPTLAQLYAGKRATLAAVGQMDYHTGQLDQFQIITSGNAQLQPEEGKTYTAGVVYQPGWLPGFSASIDGYSIQIDNAIDTPGYDAILRECEATNGAAPACALVSRPLPFSDRTPANNATAVSASPVNIASLKRKGVDFEASYHAPVSDYFAGVDGEFSVRAFASYSPTFDRKASTIAATEHYAGGINGIGPQNFAFPKLTGSIEFGYETGPFSVSLVERFTGSYEINNLAVVKDKGRIPNVPYTDINLNYKLDPDGKVQAFLNVQNLLDRSPPFVPDSGNAGLAFPTNKQFYDVVGRYMTGGVRFRY